MNKNWNAHKLEELIIEEINNLAIGKRLKDVKEQKIDYEKMIKKVDEKMERVLSLYTDGNIPVALLNKQIGVLEQEREELQKRKKQQEVNQNNSITEKELKQYTLDINTADFPTRQAIVQKLIKQITIYDEDIEIIWNF